MAMIQLPSSCPFYSLLPWAPTRIPIPQFLKAGSPPSFRNIASDAMAEKQKGDFRVDHLQVSQTSADAENWHLVLDNLNLGEMPPEGKKEPPEVEREKVADWIAQELRRSARALKGDNGEVVFRRMNRKEFEYTVEDLFGVKGEYASGFPEDAEAGHFDNNGAALTLSAEQMEAYMKATDYILGRAIMTHPQPETKSLYSPCMTTTKGRLLTTRRAWSSRKPTWPTSPKSTGKGL